jgi:hypothetical protein
MREVKTKAPASRGATESAWRPTPADLAYLHTSRHKLQIMVMVDRAVCGGCGRSGFLSVTHTRGMMHRVRCRCGWRGKIIEPSRG